MLGIKNEVAVYVYSGALDMRVSFDRLVAKVKEGLNRSPLNGGLYVFFSRSRERVKVLYWERDGYCLWQKRLEVGKYKVEGGDGYDEVTFLDLNELLNGVEMTRIRLRKNVEKGLYA